jgi:hypothetical protein
MGFPSGSPEDLWPFYSQALIRKYFGLKGTLYFTYVLGILIVIIALIGFWNGLNDIAKEFH